MERFNPNELGEQLNKEGLESKWIKVLQGTVIYGDILTLAF